MDIDGNGIPCETVYPEAEAEWNRVLEDTLILARAFWPVALEACNAYSLEVNGTEPFDGSEADPTVGGRFSDSAGYGLQRYVDRYGDELVVDLVAEVVTGPNGPTGTLPPFYSFACPSDVFVGTMGEGSFDDGDPTEAPPVREVLDVDPGGYPTIREGAIVRGDPVHVYAVPVTSCCTGESLYITVRSLEDKASFSLISPDGAVLIEDAMDASIELSKTGDYTVEIAATRGNASYTLELGISVDAS